MRYQHDFKNLKTILTVLAKNEHGLKFSFGVYPYKRVLSIGSSVMKNGEVIGHVIMGDYEKKLTLKRKRFIQDYIDRNNISMIFFFRSSRNKYHFIIPQVFDFLTAIYHAHNLDAENNYLTLSSARGEFILRISKKGKKDEPRFKTYFKSNFKGVLSQPHCRLISRIYNISYSTFKGYDKTGEDTIVEKYNTTNI